MDERLQRRVQRYGWDKASEHYERFWAGQLAPAHALLLDIAALTPGESVLDVACGTGLVTFAAANNVGPAGRVVGTDLSAEMIRAITARAARLGVRGEFSRQDAEALDLPDATFDAALCALGLMYVPDAVKALREMRRVLKPGARAVASVWGARKNCGWAEIFPIVERRVASEVCPLFFLLGTGDALCDAFTFAGFRNVEMKRISATLDYASAEDALGASFAGGPVALAYAHFDAATRDSAHAEYLESIAAWKTGTGYAVPGEFVVVRGEA
ncbi:MAG: class I SAM-dependent methyltransferase [Gemmatimonadales bacterium]